jgi:hypothetical protein
MHNLDKHMKTTQTQLRHWAEKAKLDYPAHLETTVRHAVDRLDPAGLARASEEVVATVTGNRKTARRARKAVEATLRKAQRKAGSKHRVGGRVLTVLGTVAVIGLVAVLVIRRAAGPHNRNLGLSNRHDSDSTKGIDPDLGE